MKFELIRYVVKEERLCGTRRYKEGLQFASTVPQVIIVIRRSASLQLFYETQIEFVESEKKTRNLKEKQTVA